MFLEFFSVFKALKMYVMAILVVKHFGDIHIPLCILFLWVLPYLPLVPMFLFS